jgi:TetR/AcrR family transcriptional repressor of nem operon
MTRVSAEAKLDRTMGVFWERGYYDTSVDQLVRRTGLHRAAVYGEFGSKRGLFEASLRRYREKVTAQLFAPLAHSDASLADIETFVRGIHAAATRPERRPGCLMVNTAAEVSPRVPSVARIVSTFLDDLRGLFRRACLNSRRRGEVRPDLAVDQVADYLVGSVLGLWTLARSPASPGAIAHYVEGVLAFLDALRPDARGVSQPRRRRRPSRDKG